MKKLALPLLIIIACYSCDLEKGPDHEEEGYKPVYIDKNVAFLIEPSGPAILEDPGKMYLYNQFIYIVDKGTGVHIIDNTTPSNPKKLKFISIPGVHDAVVKNDILYVDNFTDLVSLDISDLSNITITKRVKNMYPLENQLYPEFATGYFECVDTTRGYVHRWERVTLIDPKCYR